MKSIIHAHWGQGQGEKERENMNLHREDFCLLFPSVSLLPRVGGRLEIGIKYSFTRSQFLGNSHGVRISLCECDSTILSIYFFFL